MGIVLMTGSFSASAEGTSMDGYFFVLVTMCFASFTTTFAFEFIVTVVVVCAG